MRTPGLVVGWALVAGTGCAAKAPPPPPVARAEKLLAEAAPRTGELRLRCTPPDAEVELDGVPQGRCDDFDGNRGLRVGTGVHRVELKKSGFWPYVTYYEASGARAVLEAKLIPLSSEGASK